MRHGFLGGGMNFNRYGLLGTSQRRAEDADKPVGYPNSVFIQAEVISLVLDI